MSSPATSDLLYDRPATGPGTTYSSSLVSELDGRLGLSVLMKAPTARLMTCAKQLVEQVRKESCFLVALLTVNAGRSHQI